MQTPTAQDIPAVRGAFNGTSFMPEKREAQYIASYIEAMEEVRQKFEQWRTDDNAQAMDNDLEYYRSQYARLFNAYLASHSRVVSSMIAGPSNFPVARMQKRNNIVHNRWLEFDKWQGEAYDRLLRKYDPYRLAHAPIRLDDENAVEKLEEKIAKLERNQEIMKAANKILRAKKMPDEEKRAALLATPGINSRLVDELMTPQYGRLEVPAYMLSNNNANIRRLKERLVQVQQEQKRETAVVELGPVTITQNTEACRLQIAFPGKPSPAMIKCLKSHGFKWSPTNEVWQRLLNNNAIWSYKTYVRPVILAEYQVEAPAPAG